MNKGYPNEAIEPRSGSFALLAALAIRCLLAFFVLSCGVIFAQDRRALPPGSNVINVKDHGAVGDGAADDTAAIRAAVKTALDRQGRYATPPFVYFPSGTYLLSDSIEGKVGDHGWSGGWRAGLILWGESREKSVLKLKDRLEAFADPENPRPVLATGSESDKTTKAGDKPLNGGGNRAFRHGINNLTVDVGAGNPGAVGIDFVNSNRGGIEHVTIRSGDPEHVGNVGLKLTRNWPGPGLVRDVFIDGFDRAIEVSHGQYSMTFEHIKFRNQRVGGVKDSYHQALFFRGLDSAISGPVFELPGDRSMLVLLDSALIGGKPDTAAIIGKPTVYARNLKVEGYANALNLTNGKTPVAQGDELLSAVPITIGEKTPAPLAIEESPEFWPESPDDWTNVVTAGATPNKSDDDDADAIQAAIDSGKPAVLLPSGSYHVGRTLIVRGGVRLITGTQSSLGATPGAYVDPLIRIEGEGPAVTLQHLWFSGAVEHAGRRAAAFRHCDLNRGYRNTPEGTGDVFLDDIIGKPIIVAHPQRLFARQLNCEFGDDSLIENHGGAMWIFGYKTEGQMTVIKNLGGQVELLGGLFYPLKEVSSGTPLFINDDGGTMRLTYVMNGKDYPLNAVTRARGQASWRTVTAKQIPGRGPALLTVGP